MTLAHGLGGGKDLPIPQDLAIAGAVAALVLSFTVLAVAWRTSRFDTPTTGRPAPAWLARLADSPLLGTFASAIGMAFTIYIAVAALFGPDTLLNPFLGSIYVLLWVGIVPASLLLGPVYRAVSPARTINRVIARLSGAPADQGLFRLPDWVGCWPAALGLLSFVWLELVYPQSTAVGAVRLWCALYLGIMLIGSAMFGGRFLAAADPFEVYSSLVGKLSVWGRRDGRLVIRSPLANLATIEARPGLVAVVAVLFGSTAFDSFRESPQWLEYVQSISTHRIGPDTLALLAFCVGVLVILTAATMATGVDASISRRALPGLLAHSIVPIIVGYMVAHYLSYFAQQGQSTVIHLSDPLGTGADLLGTADLQVNYWLQQHPTLLASTKVLAVVSGHVLGAIAAHDRAIRLLPARHQLTGQLPLLFAMVVFTGGGLYLLFAS